MLTGQVPFTADNFMGILTKHLLEPPVPPRKRRPDMAITPEVEAICLRAMEKERDKRFPDMDALYRAFGAAGDFAFEPSQVFVAPRAPKASLKYPTLATLNQENRESRTAIAVGSGTFEDERPGRPGGGDEAPAGSRKPLVIAAVVGAALIGVGALVFALKPSSNPVSPEPAAAAATPAAVKPAAPVNAAPTPAAATPPAAATTPAAAPAEAPKPAAAEAAPASETPKPSRSHRRRSDSDEPRADPLHRKIAVPAEQTPTPGDLKAFPSN